MPENIENKNVEINKKAGIYFKCKYCGVTQPLDQLVVMRQFYPPISVCNDCAKYSANSR